jgi:ABC-2 type transport system permease protein
MTGGMTGWLRYPRILSICWRAAVSTELEYRLNFASNALLSLFWMVWAAAGASVYFQFTGGLAGWTYPELLVVIGLFFTVNGLRQLLFQPNLERMADYVRRGTLDFLLTKPVDAQLLVSLRHIGIHNALDPVLGLALTGTALALSGTAVSVGALASFVLVFGAALALLYALMLALMALSVVLVGAEELDQVAFGAVELSRFPVQLYRNPLQTVLTVVPVAFLTTFPAQALLGRLEPALLLASPAASLVAVTLATLLWRRSLRHYAGASA